jgi:hypothetical protein
LGRVEYDKEYRDDNKDKRLEQMKKYYENNRDKINQYRKEALNCPHCGCTYKRTDKSKHEKTKKHKKNMSDDESTISDITI